MHTAHTAERQTDRQIVGMLVVPDLAGGRYRQLHGHRDHGFPAVTALVRGNGDRVHGSTVWDRGDLLR